MSIIIFAVSTTFHDLKWQLLCLSQFQALPSPSGNPGANSLPLGKFDCSNSRGPYKFSNLYYLSSLNNPLTLRFQKELFCSLNESSAGGAGPTTPTLVGPKILSFMVKALYFQSYGRTNNCQIEVHFQMVGPILHSFHRPWKGHLKETQIYTERNRTFIDYNFYLPKQFITRSCSVVCL